LKRITVDPPQSDARRERVERQVFAELQRMRMAERADAAIPEARFRGWLVAAAFAAAATMAVALFATHSTEIKIAEREVPSQITTPIGGTSQFTVGDAVMVAASDTSVEVKHGDDGGITLVLARGSVDCDVAPRNGRPPFHVLAGDIAVEVVGTRFTVTRTPTPRVDVTRGKVRVTAPGGSWLVAAGQSWSPSVSTTVAKSEPAPEPTVAPETPTPTPTPETPTPAPVVHRVSSQAAFLAAGRLEATDPARASKAFRTIASGKDAWAAPALYALTELHASSDRDAALADCAEYLRRFPHDPQAEDVTWLRVEILRTAGRRDEARSAAAEYLRQFAHGSYAGLAERIATPN